MTFIAGPAVREVNQNPVGVAAKIVLPDREQMISPTRSTRRSTRLQVASPNISWPNVHNVLVAAYCRAVARNGGRR
jgi:hypothetical protein